jgi:hypothetical protein
MPVSPSDLAEAYNSNTAYLPLMPVVIDRALQEGSRKWSPLSRAFPRKTWLTLKYIFNQRQALAAAQMTTKSPTAGQVPYSGSTFVENSFDIKNMETDLSIAKIDQQVASVNGSVYDLELQGAAESMKRLEDVMHLYGNANATLASKRPQWNGVDAQLANTSDNRQNGGQSAVNFTILDGLLDVVRDASAQELDQNDYFWLMSGRMESYLARQLTNQQHFVKTMTKIFSRTDFGDPDADVADNYLDAGVEVATYRNIPIIFSSFLSSIGSMPAVSIAAAGSGSQLTNVALYYVVEAVTRYGLSKASVEVTITPTAGQNVTLTWGTPVINDRYGNPLDIFQFRVYRGTATGAESLYALVSATDASDNPVTNFVDTGVPSVPVPGQTYTNLYTTVASNTGGTIAQPNGFDFPRLQVGGKNLESIYLLPRNPDFCVVPVLNEMTPVMLAPTLARSSQFALIADMCLAMRNGSFAAKVDQVSTM